MAAISILAASCAKEMELEDPAQHPSDKVYDGFKVTLVGESLATKASIGEKDGTAYPLLWSEGDAVVIYSKTGTNIAAEKATLKGEAGKAVAEFETENGISVTADEDIVILYPSTLTYAEGVVKTTIPAVRTVEANSSAHIGKYMLSYAQTTLAANQTDGVNFTLEQKTAFVKLGVATATSTSTYAGYSIVSAELYAEGAELAGEASYTVASQTLAVANASDKVGVTFDAPVPLSDQLQSFYFTALPCDLSSKTVYLIFTLSKDGSNITVPVELTGRELKAGHLSVIEIPALESAVVDWYEPIETRDMLNGVAYGPQNTYYVQRGGGSDANVVLDVRARGDFFKVAEPKSYGIFFRGGSENKRALYIDSATESLPENYHKIPTHAVQDGRISLKFNRQPDFNWGIVAVYAEEVGATDCVPLWSFMICGEYSSDPVETVTLGGYKMMDRILGVRYSNERTVTDQYGFDTGSMAYFQWGRKDPFPWSISNAPHYEDAATNSTISNAIAHPEAFFASTNQGSSGNTIAFDWCGESSRVLWGGATATKADMYTASKGKKTIYDPCPEGYRVPDPGVFKYLMDNAIYWETTATEPDELYTASKYHANGQSAIKVPTDDSSYDYWTYAGGFWGTYKSGGWTNRTNDAKAYATLYWSNCSPTDVSISRAAIFSKTNKSANVSVDAYKSIGAAIRCQVDE